VKRRSLRRLADSSIWIAFYRIGRFEVLLKLPNIAIARPALRELRLGSDDLPDRVQDALADDCFDLDVSNSVSDTLGNILGVKDRRLSQADAAQVAYACHHSDRTVLYMRDGPAERQAKQIGAPVRNHEALVEDMVELQVVTLEEGADLRRQLDVYFAKRREGKRLA